MHDEVVIALISGVAGFGIGLAIRIFGGDRLSILLPICRVGFSVVVFWVGLIDLDGSGSGMRKARVGLMEEGGWEAWVGG